MWFLTHTPTHRYNPAHDSESRLLLHRAAALQDMAHSILEHELSEEFEQQCEDIEDTYKKLGRKLYNFIVCVCVCVCGTSEQGTL